MKHVVAGFFLVLIHAFCAHAQTGPGSSAPFDSSQIVCRDFISLDQMSLPICDFVMTERLKTELLSLLITEQKNIDLLIKNSGTSPEDKKRWSVLKSNLFNVEQFAVQKITDICALKGRIIEAGANLVAGCTFNQFNKMKNILLLIKNSTDFVATDSQWPALEEQVKFDTFIDDLLLDLAEKNKQETKNNSQIKGLMLEILKIYGNNGLSLYAAFWGICGLETIVQTKEGQAVDPMEAIQCEEKYLSDLRQVLFLAID